MSTILGVDSPLKIGRKQLQVSIRIAEAGEVYVLKVRATRSAG